MISTSHKDNPWSRFIPVWQENRDKIKDIYTHQAGSRYVPKNVNFAKLVSLDVEKVEVSAEAAAKWYKGKSEVIASFALVNATGEWCHYRLDIDPIDVVDWRTSKSGLSASIFTRHDPEWKTVTYREATDIIKLRLEPGFCLAGWAVQNDLGCFGIKNDYKRVLELNIYTPLVQACNRLANYDGNPLPLAGTVFHLFGSFFQELENQRFIKNNRQYWKPFLPDGHLYTGGCVLNGHQPELDAGAVLAVLFLFLQDGDVAAIQEDRPSYRLATRRYDKFWINLPPSTTHNIQKYIDRLPNGLPPVPSKPKSALCASEQDLDWSKTWIIGVGFADSAHDILRFALTVTTMVKEKLNYRQKEVFFDAVGCKLLCALRISDDCQPQASLIVDFLNEGPTQSKLDEALEQHNDFKGPRFFVNSPGQSVSEAVGAAIVDGTEGSIGQAISERRIILENREEFKIIQEEIAPLHQPEINITHLNTPNTHEDEDIRMHIIVPQSEIAHIFFCSLPSSSFINYISNPHIVPETQLNHKGRMEWAVKGGAVWRFPSNKKFDLRKTVGFQLPGNKKYAVQGFYQGFDQPQQGIGNLIGDSFRWVLDSLPPPPSGWPSLKKKSSTSRGGALVQRQILANARKRVLTDLEMADHVYSLIKGPTNSSKAYQVFKREPHSTRYPQQTDSSFCQAFLRFWGHALVAKYTPLILIKNESRDKELADELKADIKADIDGGIDITTQVTYSATTVEASPETTSVMTLEQDNPNPGEDVHNTDLSPAGLKSDDDNTYVWNSLAVMESWVPFGDIKDQVSHQQAKVLFVAAFNAINDLRVVWIKKYAAAAAAKEDAAVDAAKEDAVNKDAAIDFDKSTCTVSE